MSKGNAELPPPNYTAVPNVFLDDVLSRIESMSELKVTLAVMRKTFGWQKKADKISVSQLIELTGLSEQSVRNGLQSGMKRGTILRIPDGQSYSYSLNIKAEGVQDLDPPKSYTPLKVIPQLPQDLDPQGVQDLDPQKKPEKKIKESKNVGASAIAPAPSAQSVQKPESLHARLMRVLYERVGPISDGGKQGKAIKQLEKGITDGFWTEGDCVGLLDEQLRQIDDPKHWRNGAVSWLTVSQEIGTHMNRRRAGANGNATAKPPPRACRFCDDTGEFIRMNLDTKQDERVECSCRKKTNTTAKPRMPATTH